MWENEVVVAFRPRRREHARLPAREQGLDLGAGAAHRCRGGNDLGRWAIGIGPHQPLDGGLVETGQGAEGAADQMQFILDDQLRRRQTTCLQVMGAALRFGRSPEAGGFRLHGSGTPLQLVGGHVAEQGGGLAHPGQGRELVDGGDQEAGQAPVDLFIDRQHRQGRLLIERTGADMGEITLAEGVGLGGVGHRAAVDHQPIGGPFGQKVEALGLQRTVAPGAGFDRNRPVGALLLPAVEHVVGALGVGVVRATELVGGGALAYPHADLKRPIPQLVGVVFSDAALAFELQGADHRGGTAELIEGEQAQGVAHQHREAGTADAGVAQAPQHQREGRKAQIGLGFAATGREEKQLHDLPLGASFRGVWFRQARQVHQHEGQLEEAPLRGFGIGQITQLLGPHLAVERRALALGLVHHQVHGAKGLAHQGIGEGANAGLDAVGAFIGQSAEVAGGGDLLRLAHGFSRLLGNPAVVGLHHRQQAIDHPLAPGQVRQHRHPQRHLNARRGLGTHPQHRGRRQPGGGERGAALFTAHGDDIRRVREHRHVVPRRKAEIPPVLQSRQPLIAVFVGLQQGVTPGRKALGAVELQLHLEGRHRIAEADLLAAALGALVEQEHRHRELVGGIAELAGGSAGDPAQAEAVWVRLQGNVGAWPPPIDGESAHLSLGGATPAFVV